MSTDSTISASRPIVTVGALACDPDGHVLVVQTHKWRHTWGVPGGKIDPGEPMAEALVREFAEETGLNVRDVQFVAVYEAIQSAEFYKPDAHMILLNFVCRCDGGPVTLSDEAQAYRWVTPEEADQLPLNSFTRQLLADARHLLHTSPPEHRIQPSTTSAKTRRMGASDLPFPGA
ncbi:MAG: NUDIX domain-containing protein [Candidatus Sericytochromatia bacterium]|nr:NUDIX domain-containing protein [Candidatus Sericytochromatia bacterium]